jgi:carbon-monoxide dehydrogenase large subunit
MTQQIKDAALGIEKFGIGQPVRRSEDPVLVRGEGRYSDDVNLAGQIYGVMVRSPIAHGLLRGIDASAAKAMQGVLAVYTAKDLEPMGYGLILCALPITNRDGSAMLGNGRSALAHDKVRYVGDPVALVVAQTREAAIDAAEAVQLDIEALPAVTDARDAVKDGAPLLYDAVPNNIAVDYHWGDSNKVATAFQKAAHVTRLTLRNNRIIVAAMEPRSAVAAYDARTGDYTLHANSQGVFGMRANLSAILGIAPEKMHVRTGHVGGSFGMKISVFPEYICLLHASRMLGKPVKWTDRRSDSFLSDFHGRDTEVTAELALDAKGHFLAIRVNGFGNLGGYMSPFGPMMPTLNVVKNMLSVYKTPLIEVSVKCALTNTVPVAAYRGAGRPEGNYYMERLIETAAREMGLSSVTIRKRNHIKPQQLPYRTPGATLYDSGAFSTILEKALEGADYKGFSKRRKQSARQGLLRGIGIGQYLEVTAPPMNEMGGIRFEEDGTITLLTGTLDFGQGHATAFAQVVVQKLGVPFDKIRLIQGNSDLLIAGGGTGGSKSSMASGAALSQAGDIVIERGRKIAAHVLEAGLHDIVFETGHFTIAGTDRSISLMELARRVKTRQVRLPADLPQTLDVDHIFKEAPSAYPNGCHIAEVEIDPDTGTIHVVRYTAVNDFGVIINPMLVEGQLHGGVMQGIGQALIEHTVYDEDGQLVTGSFMDYGLPRADMTPPFTVLHHPVPAKTNLLGAKGCGEAGCAGSLPSVMNAIVDALSVYGITHIDMPATPQLVWQAIQAAKSKKVA